MKKENLSTLFSGILVVCALIITGLVVKKEMFPEVDKDGKKVRQIGNWQVLEKWGHHYWGSKKAPVQIIEFFDYQCPYCGEFERTLKKVQAKYDDNVAVVKYNFPLQMHEYAYPAAIAAECAGMQDHYAEYSKLLFKNQHHLENVNWDSLAVLAHIRSLKSFHQCIRQQQPSEKIDKHIQLAREISVNSTPTVVINGKMVSGALSFNELDNYVQDAMH